MTPARGCDDLDGLQGAILALVAPLVPRFRIPWYIAAPFGTEFGSEGALASVWL